MSATEIIDLDDDVIIETAPPAKPTPTPTSSVAAPSNSSSSSNTLSSTTASSTTPSVPPRVSAAVAALSPENRELYDRISAQFAQDGTRELLKRHLKDLLLESTWKDEVSKTCQNIVSQKGFEQVTLQDLVTATDQKAKECVPGSVEQDMKDHIRKVLVDRARKAQHS